MTKTTHDAVNHPSHYTQYPVEVIELTRHMNFCKGNAVKYIARAGFKGGPEKELEDIDKAIWYLKDERAAIAKKLREGSLIVDGKITADKLIQTGVTNTFTINPPVNVSEDVINRIVAAQTEANFTKGLWHGNSDDKKVQD